MVKKLAIVFVLLLCIPSYLVLSYEKASFNHEIFIKAPPADVFPAVTDPGRLKHWVSGFKGYHSASAGQATLLVEWDGTLHSIDQTITKWERNRVLHLRLEARDAFLTELKYQFVPAGGGTLLRLNQDTARLSLAGKLFASSREASKQNHQQQTR